MKKEMMRTAVMQKTHEVTIEEREIPEPAAHEVLVKVSHVGICGSDVHYYTHGRIGHFVVENPMVLGHESAGVVVKTGADVSHVKPGDLVALEPGVPCGCCEFCRTGRYNLCPDVVFMATPPFDGAFSEYVAWPASMAFRLPEGMSTLEGALIEPLAVGFHAVAQSGIKVGQTAVVLGAGCIGLVTMMALHAAGISDVIVTDVIESRLALASKLGATAVLHAAEVSVPDKVAELTGGRGADAVFETAGNRTATAQTAEIVCRGGTVVLVGMAPDPVISYDFGQLMSKEAEIKTVFRYRNLYPAAIRAVAAGKIPLKEIVTDTFCFPDVDEALRMTISKKQDVIKGVIAFN